MKTFCVLPWFGYEIRWHKPGTYCCLLSKKHDIHQIRRDMLENRRPDACQKCWNNEDNGITSDRQLKNAALDFYWDRDLESIYQECATIGNEQILMLKLTTSNTCNGTCVTCGPEGSSSWDKLIHRSNPVIPIKPINPINFIDIEQLEKSIDLKKLKMLSLIGGEPLYEKKNFNLLEKIFNLGNESIFISIVTNGNTILSTRQKDILSKFRNLNISISIDGVGPVFEYLRFPLKWERLLQNIEFFREITSNISCSYTISNLNILYHNETVKWLNDNQIRFLNNPVTNPEYFNPKFFPEGIKEILKQRLRPNDYNAFVGPEIFDQDQKNFKLFLSEIKKQDAMKKIKIHDYLPELANLLDRFNLSQ